MPESCPASPECQFSAQMASTAIANVDAEPCNRTIKVPVIALGSSQIPTIPLLQVGESSLSHYVYNRSGL